MGDRNTMDALTTMMVLFFAIVVLGSIFGFLFGFHLMPFGMMGMMGFGFIFWIIVIIAVVSLIEEGKPSKNPLEILKERYAKGEITRAEFQRMKKEL
ncbi:MAG: SHOCT domain-containing protein [Candidatus Micrarchaeota archaeon]